MIGLRAENDHASKSFFSTTANRKTYRFAEHYSGRFFVSGVSGSFAKYSKQLKQTDQKYLRQEKKYVHEPVLEKHQKEELRRDAQRLLEMEEQLAHLQKMRELKRQRDRARRKKKLEYMSACCIQRAFRCHALYQRNKSADIVVSFLR
jgi:cell shape-determining protein MreC